MNLERMLRQFRDEVLARLDDIDVRIVELNTAIRTNHATARAVRALTAAAAAIAGDQDE